MSTEKRTTQAASSICRYCKSVVPAGSYCCPKCGVLQEKNEVAEEKDIYPGEKANKVSIILKVIALLIFIGAFTVGCIVGDNVYGEFGFGVALPYWAAGLISGMIFLGFGEIIELLSEIEYNTRRK